MSTTAAEARKPVNRIYNDVYIKRRKSDGTYEAEWFDISRLVANNLGAIKYSLDSKDFDIGVITQDNVSMTFDNSDGRFNSNDDSRSLWASYISPHLTKVRIDFGYIDPDTDEQIEDLTFEGFLDEKSVRVNSADRVSATILSLTSIFKAVEVPAGTFGSSLTVKNAVKVLLSRSEITAHITVDEVNINPDLNFTIDDPSVYNSKKIDSVLNELMLLSNSIAFVDPTKSVVVRGRDVGNSVSHRFYKNPRVGAKPDNVYKVTAINSGRQRLKNFVFWQGGSINSQSAEVYRQRYGTTKRPVSAASVTNTVTQQSIVSRILDEWQFPKQELEIEVDYLGTLAQFLQVVTLDVRPSFERIENLPISGEAVSGTAVSVGFSSGIFLIPEKGYKVIEIRHDLKSAKTVLKLREKGKTLTDGYFDLLKSKKYDLEFVAAAEVTVNTVADGINSQCCQVQVFDPSDDYAVVDLKVTAPSTGTLKFETGSAITKTFEARVIEVVAS